MLITDETRRPNGEWGWVPLHVDLRVDPRASETTCQDGGSSSRHRVSPATLEPAQHAARPFARRAQLEPPDDPLVPSADAQAGSVITRGNCPQNALSARRDRPAPLIFVPRSQSVGCVWTIMESSSTVVPAATAFEHS